MVSCYLFIRYYSFLPVPAASESAPEPEWKEVFMSNLDALSVCKRLEADKTLATLFDILRDYGDAPAALWLKGEQELSSS